jgi:hypothetical protein
VRDRNSPTRPRPRSTPRNIPLWEPISPEAGSDSHAGRFRYDILVYGQIRILAQWLVSSSEQQVVDRIAAVLGRQPHTYGVENAQSYHLLTSVDTVSILLDSIRIQMVRRQGTAVLRLCDCRTQRTIHGERPCQCPATLKARWQAAKAGQGCEPLVQVTFRLVEDPMLGSFVFSSAAWTFAEHAAGVKTALRDQRRPYRAHLRIDRTLHTTAGGTSFAHTRPAIEILPGP